MRNIFKKALLGVSALVLPFTLAIATNADTTTADNIDTTLEYQLSEDGSSIRYISTMVLNNSTTLDDIKSIDMTFTIKSGETEKTKSVNTTTVYESISGTNGKDAATNTYYAVFTITDLTDSYIGWTLTPTFTYNFKDSSTESPTCTSWLIGGTRLYFVETDSSWGTTLYAYMWEDGADPANNNSWPGGAMQVYDATNNIYCFDYLASNGYDRIIFNNKGEGGKNTAQTSDITLSTEYSYYIQDGTNANAHPTASHNWVSSNANEHECSICGAEGHTLTITSDNGTNRTVTCSECEFSATFSSTTLYFTAPASWTTVYVHRWNDTGDLKAWPGIEATYVTTNEYNQKIYSVSIKDGEEIATKVIFHNNNGTQTGTITISDYSPYNSLYLKDTDNPSTSEIGCYLYIPS